MPSQPLCQAFLGVRQCSDERLQHQHRRHVADQVRRHCRNAGQNGKVRSRMQAGRPGAMDILGEQPLLGRSNDDEQAGEHQQQRPIELGIDTERCGAGRVSRSSAPMRMAASAGGRADKEQNDHARPSRSVNVPASAVWACYRLPCRCWHERHRGENSCQCSRDRPRRQQDDQSSGGDGGEGGRKIGIGYAGRTCRSACSVDCR